MIPQVTDVYPGSYLREIVSSMTPGWSAHNPSIAQGISGDYRCIVRSANYVYRDGQFICTAPDGMVKTKNFLCDLSDELEVLSMDLIDDSAVRGPVLFPWVQGVEDARLFTWRGDWFYSGTIREHREDGTPKIAVDRLEGTTVAYRRILEGPEDALTEKNWMPFVDVDGNVDRWVYSCDPPTVTSGWGDVTSNPAVGTPASFRGGTQVISIDGGEMHLALTHEVTWEPDRHYWHRIVAFDALGFTTGWSEPFYFVEPGCEFAAGLVQWKDNLVVSFGTGEARAMLAVIPKALALGSITPAPGCEVP